MTLQLKLARTADFDLTDTETLNLLSFTDGIDLADNGWTPNVAADSDITGNAPIDEVLNLYLKGADHDTLAAYDIALRKILSKAAWYSRSAERYGLWLRAQLSGETGARQALIVEGTGGRTGVMSYDAAINYFVQECPVMLRRMPLWEATNHITVPLQAAISSVGGKASLGTIAGGEPARIGYAEMYGDAAVLLNEFWCGFRTSRYGTVANFVSPWELESGTAGTDTAVGTDATASPGGAGNTKMACSFATATAMTTRVTLTGQQISAANYEDQRGTFDLILRAKCASGITALVELGGGLPGTSSYTTCNSVSVTGTSWKLYYLGRITLPGGGKSVPSYSSMANSTIRLRAQLTAGTAVANALDMDCLIPIPVDEGYFHIKSDDAGALVIFLISPAGHVTGYGGHPTEVGADTLDGVADCSGISPISCTLPVGAATSIWAAQRSAGSTLEDDLLFTFDYFMRYRLLRGNEGALT